VIYLGQTLPFSELIFAHEVHKPDFIFSILTSVPANEEVQPYVDRLCSQFPETQILLTGYQVVGQDIQTGPNAAIINKTEDLVDYLH
jgi:hypothetical protein